MSEVKREFKFVCEADPEHNPRSVFICEFNRWFLTEETDKIVEVLTPEIEWEMVGEETVSGLEAVKESFISPENLGGEPRIEEMIVEGIITHGRLGSSYGTMTMSDGQRYRFNDVLEFKNLSRNFKVKKIISFVVKI